ncbi:helix-turn-helix domain-containing protein [Microbispora bryophytorum]|uniref:Helix-turn-helix transcriptional regulator n=1 Tax=Microbispora bryophytorum subsp. camponoti TaxID=1677852 RepID=A0ABR8L9F7_9ACTN|nr:helix-turn-helix transcriptional regulator [Microbispora camponoti]MBD3147554.1 helix-turn-helix transcriptional regulator [Microbispora camponoti]
MSDDLPAWAVRLRAERRNRLWSQREMARRLVEAADEDIRPHLPSRETMIRRIKAYEAGHNRPGDPYRVLYARAFGLTEVELFGEDRVAAPGQCGAACQGRRDDVLAADSINAGATMYSPHYGSVAPEVVMYFLEQLPGHYKADMWLGPRHLIPTVATQAELIRELAQAADAPVRRGLLGAGVAYAALLGWLYQDAGDVGRSRAWRAVTLDMAHRSQDPQLVSYALTNQAMLAVDLDDGRTVVDYAEAALADESKLCPKARVLALVHQAHGQSMLPEKNKDLVDRLLDRAAELVDWIDDEYLWGNACRRTQGYVDVQRATAYLRLGAYREAVALWDRVLGTAPESARRDNGVFWARQAAALAAVPEPERVVQIASAAASTVEGTGSVRLGRELRVIPQHAVAWAGTAAGHELADILAPFA